MVRKEKMSSPRADVQLGAGRLTLRATVLNKDTERTFLELEYPALDGRRKLIRLPRELFRLPHRVADELVRVGADLQDATAEVLAILPAHLNLPYREVTRRTGWHGTSFVYPTKTYGPLADKLHYDPSPDIDPALGLTQGTLNGWREGLRSACLASDYVLFGASLAAGSILLDIVGETEGAIFHLHGRGASSRKSGSKQNSTSGKTTTARVALSAVGRCENTDLMTFDISPRAVEDLCFSHNHLIVGLDEEGRAHAASPGRIRPQHLPYLVPGGRGAVRSIKASQDATLKNRTWALFAIATGEIPLDRGPHRRAEGAQVRQIALPVPPGHMGGIFNRLSGTKDQIVRKARALAEEIEDTLAANHGMAAKAFLGKVVHRRRRLKAKILKLVDSFVAAVGATSDPWERRFARKLGIVFAAAFLLAKYDVAPWTKARASRALARIYSRARRAIDAGPHSFANIIRRLADLIKDSDKFPLIKRGQHRPTSASALGFTKKREGRRCVFVARSRIEELMGASPGATSVLNMLASRKILIRGAGGKLTMQVLTKDGRVRFVCLDRKALLRAARSSRT